METRHLGMGKGGRRGLTVLVGTLLLAACGGGGETDATAAETDTAAAGFTRVLNVAVLELEPQPFAERLELTGTVQANRDVVVSAEESGVVRETFVEKGADVRTGQPLLRIDDSLLRTQVQQAEAQAALARETWERRKRLYEEDRVGSELAYLEARYAAEQAEANLETLRERLARTVVRAPISGVLEDRQVEVGTMVQAGTPVARIIDLDPVEVSAGVPERFAADVERGAEVTVTFGAFRGQRFDGRVSYVGSAVDPRNRTFPIELTLPNPGRAIKPEMVAEVSLVRRQIDDALVVPQQALVRVEDGFVVFVASEEGEGTVAVSRPVTVGGSSGNRVVVTQGLEVGDRIIVRGQQQVASGDRVRIVEGAEG